MPNRRTLPNPPLAVVFVHGFLGFERIRLARKEIRYFRGVWRRLAAAGVPLYFPALPPVGRIAVRARKLASCLDRVRAERIGLISHSMGGLDSRYLIQRLDPGRRVRFLATVATPHRGTPLAQWLMESKGIIPWASRQLILPGLAELTPHRCRRFNRVVPDRPDVTYHAYAGRRGMAELPPWLRPWSRLIARQEGDNDSMVSVRSARWGEFKGCLRADHLELAGWNLYPPVRRFDRPFDHFSLYRRILRDASDAALS
jgi:triacylglycerol lipase